jgi:hypothetical protein
MVQNHSTTEHKVYVCKCTHFLLDKWRIFRSTRAVWKVRGLAFLLQVGTLWRCGDCFFFEEPPLASDAFLTMLYPLLENVLQTVDHFKISCLGTPFPWLEKLRNQMGWNMDCVVDVLMGFHWSTFSMPNIEFNSDLCKRPLYVYNLIYFNLFTFKQEFRTSFWPSFISKSLNQLQPLGDIY